MPHVEASAPWSSSQWLRPRLLRRHPAVHSGPGARNGRALYRANRGQKRGLRVGRCETRYSWSQSGQAEARGWFPVLSAR